MKNIGLLLLFSVLFCCKNKQTKNENDGAFPVVTGIYFGQEKPGYQPKIFAPGIISTGKYELNSVFSPDYSEFYFTIRLLNGQMVIMNMKNVNNQWTSPEVASFSGKYEDADPFITIDGNWLYFTSKRPVDSLLTPNKDFDIWRVKKSKDSWGTPERLDSTINTDYSEVYPTLTKEGNLYFSCFGDNNMSDIFCSKWNNNSFQKAQKLDGTINDFGVGDVFVSPDDDYIIFKSGGRKEGNGLFISFKENEKWSTPKFMGHDINLTGQEYCPMLSPDRKYLFFTSERDSLKPYSDTKLSMKDIMNDYENILTKPKNKLGDIYWVDAKIIDEFRKN